MRNNYKMNFIWSTITSLKSITRKIMLELEDSVFLDLLVILIIAILALMMMVITMGLYFLILATIPLLFNNLLVEDHILSLYRFLTLALWI